MKKTIFVKDLKIGSPVTSIFVINEREVRFTKNGKPYMHLCLADRTGYVYAKIWDSAGIDFDSVPESGPVLISGKTETFQDAIQIIVEKISGASVDNLQKEDFLPALPDEDITKLVKELNKYYARLDCNWCKTLWKTFRSSTELFNKFCETPGALKIHHPYIGGLLEHTVYVLRLLSSIYPLYPDLDKDILLTGGLFHDIGKTKEYVYDWSIDVSDEGRLMGHTVMGVEIVKDLIGRIAGFPEQKAMLIYHMILSHHREAEYGAARPPMTREAMVLHFADNLDATLNEMNRIYTETGEGERWTPYQRNYGSRFFVGALNTSRSTE